MQDGAGAALANGAQGGASQTPAGNEQNGQGSAGGQGASSEQGQQGQQRQDGKDSKGPQRGPDGKFASNRPAEEKGEQPPKSKRDSAVQQLLERMDEDGNVVLKVYGKPTKMPIDRAIAQLEIDTAGRAKFTEAQKKLQQAEQTLGRLKERPEDALREAGIDPEEWAERKVREKIERIRSMQDLTPEEKAKLIVEQERGELRREREEFARERQEQEIAQAAQQIVPLFEKHIPEAMQAAGLGKSTRGLERMKTFLGEYFQAGHLPSPEAFHYAAQAARDETVEDFQELAKTMSPAEAFQLFGAETLKGWSKELAKDIPKFLELFGEDVADGLRRYDLEQYEKSLASKQQPLQQEPPKPKTQQSRYMSEAEYKTQLRKQGLL